VQRHTRQWSSWRTPGRCILPVVIAMICAGAGVLAVSAPAPAASVSAWSIVPSANTSPAQDQRLTAVSCTSPTFCMAVGGYTTAGHAQALIEMWNGSSWSIVPSPNTSTSVDNDLNAVACASASLCVAVGDTGGAHTLAESWNGSPWTLDTTVDPSATSNGFGGVACPSATSCVAVGTYVSASSYFQTLVESWNGSTWSLVPSANTLATLENLLNGVSCSTPTSSVAVGTSQGATNRQTLTESWDGTAWSVVTSPNTSSTVDNVLNNVTCTNPSFCMAVGYDDTGSSPPSLIEIWNGRAWSIVSGPNTSVPNSDENVLYGVSCTDPSNCVAAGHWSNTGDEKTPR